MHVYVQYSKQLQPCPLHDYYTGTFFLSLSTFERFHCETSAKWCIVYMQTHMYSPLQEHQQQLQVLVQQLATSDPQLPVESTHTSSSATIPTNTAPTPHLPSGSSTAPTNHLSSSSSAATSRHNHHRQVETLKSKVKTLERELYYYKKTSRDLKKKLQVVRLSPTTAYSRGNSHKSHDSTTTASDPSTESTRDCSSHKRHDSTDIATDKRPSPTTTSTRSCNSNNRCDSTPTASDRSSSSQKRHDSTATANDGSNTESSGSAMGDRTDHTARAHTFQSTTRMSTQTDSVLLVSHIQHQDMNSPEGSKCEGEMRAMTDQVMGDSLEDGLPGQRLGLVLKSKKQLRQLRSVA